MAKAVGIDLGTTNSVVAVFEAGETVVIPNSEGGRTTPSVVAFSKAGEVLVGEVAKRQAITNPDRTFRSIKRHMGENWKSDDVDGKKYTPQEISARTLMKLKRDAEAYLGDTRHPGRHHRARVLRRRAAHRHQGSRPDRRPGSAAHHQRAHRCRAGLRPRQEQRGREGPRVRPRRRHVRRERARDRRRRVRSEEHPRRHQARWRRLGSAHHRLARPAVQVGPRCRPRGRPHGHPAPEGSRREGQDRAQPGAADPDQPAVHHGYRRRPAAPRRVAHPGQVPGDDRRPHRALPHPLRAGAEGRRHQQGRAQPRHPRRRLHPHARRHRSRAEPHRQGAQQVGQPRRSGRHRCSRAGRRAARRREGHPAARRHARSASASRPRVA